MADKATKVKPIETVYNDYRFRSRLEARWAVLFDCMGWPYQYEIEGYDLGKAGYYLPDFWIPINPENNTSGYDGAGYWVEIKGQSLSQRERIKIAALSKYTKHTVKVFIGVPGDHYHRVCHNKRVKEFVKRKASFHGRDPDCKIPFSLLALANQLGYDFEYDIEKAIQKAKQARFEHGEKPGV